MKNYRQMLEEIGGYENELTAVPARAVKEMIDHIESLEARNVKLQTDHNELILTLVKHTEGFARMRVEITELQAVVDRLADEKALSPEFEKYGYGCTSQELSARIAYAVKHRSE